MAENTKIEVAHHTLNPWVGYTKVGHGCNHCYAEGLARRSGLVQWGPGAALRRTSEANWRKPLAWNAEAARLGVRYRVFCANLADVFDNEVPAEWRSDLFDLIARTPHLDWLLVTKRIGNVGRMVEAATCMTTLPGNVWLGITVVNQAEADRDIPKLLATPAAVRFLSMEPLLGPVNVSRFMWPVHARWPAKYKSPEEAKCAGETVTYHRQGLVGAWCKFIDWVIVGGESGPHARPMHPQWARDIRDQCEAAGVPFLFKQWGEWSPRAKICGAGEDFQTLDPQCKRWPDVIRLGEHGLDTRVTENCTDVAGQEVYVQRVGKKAAGRLLDGREHNGFPGGAR